VSVVPEQTEKREEMGEGRPLALLKGGRYFVKGQKGAVVFRGGEGGVSPETSYLRVWSLYRIGLLWGGHHARKKKRRNSSPRVGSDEHRKLRSSERQRNLFNGSGRSAEAARRSGKTLS